MTSTTTAPPTTTSDLHASEELEIAVDAAASTSCATADPLRDILLRWDGDLGVDKIGIAYDLGGSQARVVLQAILGTGATPADADMYTEATGTLALVHALIHFNHHRVEMALWSFLDQPLELSVLGYLPLVDVTGDTIASWDGVTFAHGDDAEPLSVYQITRTPPRELTVGDAALSEGWRQADEWVAVVEAVTGSTSFEGVTDLEPVTIDLDGAIQLFCVLLGSEWVRNEDAIAAHGNDGGWVVDNWSIFGDELAAQELLLTTEYLRAISDHMNRPDVDWLRADGVDVSQNATDGVSSTSEYVGLWEIGIDNILARYHAWRTLTPEP